MKMNLTKPYWIAAAAAGLLALGAGGVDRGYVDPVLPSPDARPFSGAVRAGNTWYFSGTIGDDGNGKVPDDVEAEARLLLDKYKKNLEKAGLTMDDLVSVQLFCSDVAHYATWNKIYRTYFTKEFPARAFVGSGDLLYGARFEMQAIAVKR